MVGEDHSDSFFFEPQQDLLEFNDCDRIDPSEGFIQQQKFGIENQGAAYLQSTALPSGEAVCRLLRHLRES